MNLISFSLYGSNPKYLNGALENSKMARKWYPDWRTRFYVSEDISPHLLDTLRKSADDVVLVNKKLHPNGMFWRFFPILDDSVNRLLVRDVDSRFSRRESQAVQEWIESEKPLHIIRDHPMHNAPILGGLWGITGMASKQFKKELLTFKPKDYYGEDQEFLAQTIYKTLKKDALVHDQFFKRNLRSRKILEPRVDGEYIGEPFDEGKTCIELRNYLIKVEKSRVLRIRCIFRGWARMVIEQCE